MAVSLGLGIGRGNGKNRRQHAPGQETGPETPPASPRTTIELFAPEDELRRQIFSIVTDSASVADPKDPDNSSIYSILKLFCTAEERLLWADRFRSGGLGYREVKQAIYDLFMRTFGAARRLRAELSQQPDYVEEVLRQGVEKARAVAAPLLQEVREAVGIPRP